MQPFQEQLGRALGWFEGHPLAAAAFGVVVLTYVFAWCRLFARVGLHASLGLFAVLPPVALVLPFVLAFTPWPVLRELRTLRGIQHTIRRADMRNLKKAA